MFHLRATNQRGQSKTNWLDSRHSFSFGQYYDSHYMGFSDLRVINDDVVAALGEFSNHPHDNMEIITVVLSGELEHKDSLGNQSMIVAGEIQVMTAGTGIHHSEYNPSAKDSVRFLQIWITPNMKGLEPKYRQQKFDKRKMKNKLCLLVSPDAADGSLKIYQDAKIYRSFLDTGKIIEYNVKDNRAGWIQVASGSIEVNGNLLVGGDGLAVYEQDKPLEIKGIDKSSDFLLFDLRG